MEITKDTKVSAILQEYGDIADVMEVFGVKRVGQVLAFRVSAHDMQIQPFFLQA